MKKVIIERDEFSEDPRKWYCETKMICFHNRYSLGDEQKKYKKNDYPSLEELKQAIIENENPIIIEPVFMLDHSGLTLSLKPFNDKWDSGQVGYIYIPQQNMAYDDAKEELLNDFENYNDYISGEVYRFAIIEETTCECCGQKSVKLLDSCGGFISSNWQKLMTMMKDNAEAEYHYLFDEKKNWDLAK